MWMLVGLESLQSRRWYIKLAMFDKIYLANCIFKDSIKLCPTNVLKQLLFQEMILNPAKL